MPCLTSEMPSSQGWVHSYPELGRQQNRNSHQCDEILVDKHAVIRPHMLPKHPNNRTRTHAQARARTQLLLPSNHYNSKSEDGHTPSSLESSKAFPPFDEPAPRG